MYKNKNPVEFVFKIKYKYDWKTNMNRKQIKQNREHIR